MTGIELISLLKADLRKEGKLREFYDNHKKHLDILYKKCENEDVVIEICIRQALTLTLEIDRISGDDDWYE
jgi:hypothetical protein